MKGFNDLYGMSLDTALRNDLNDEVYNKYSKILDDAVMADE